MTASNVKPIRTPDFQELLNTFNGLTKPYGLNAVWQFDEAYRQMYRDLSPLERRHAEKLVDTLIADLVDQRLAERIYGVV